MMSPPLPLPRLPKPSSILILLVTICSGPSTQAKTGAPELSGDVWSQYRGPNRDGVSLSSSPVKIWAGETPKLVWKRSVGDGFSGIVVAGENLITAFAEDSTEFLASYNRLSGEENWRVDIGGMFIDDFGNGPRSTPTLDGDQVFILGSYGDLHAVDVETGRSNWTSALARDFDVKVPRRGFTTSPFVHGDVTVVHLGGAEGAGFVGLDKMSGEILWKVGDSTPSYSSPILAKIDGVTQSLFSSTRVVEENGTKKSISEMIAVGLDGQILWRGPSLPGVVAMPLVIAPNTFFVSSSTDDGCLAFRVVSNTGRYAVEELWRSREMINHFNSSVYYKGHIFGFSKSTLKCVEARTGKRKWRKRGFGKGSLIAVDQKLLVLSDRGKLVVIEAVADKYNELASAQVLEGKSWTCPTFADGQVYLRNRTEMACYDLSQ